MAIANTFRIAALAAASCVTGCGARSSLIAAVASSPDAAFDATADHQEAAVVDAPVFPPRRLEWTRVAASSASRPSARMSHFMVYDASDDSVIVLGGMDPYERRGDDGVRLDAWRLSLRTEQWASIGMLARPLLRLLGGTAFLDAANRRIVVIAARDHNAGSELLAVDLATLRITNLAPEPWPAGYAVMTAGSLSASRQIVAFGATYETPLATTWVFDVGANRWRTGANEGPPIRSHAQLVDVNDRAMLYGGYYGDPFHDLWTFDPSGGAWATSSLTNELPARLDHTVLFDAPRNRLVAFGGYASATVVHENLLLVDLASGATTEPALSPAPEGRRDHGFVMDGQRRAILFGGALDSDHCFDDTWVLTLD